MTYSVGILVFDNVEVLDFAGPYEVFTTASRVYGKQNLLSSVTPFEVFTIGKTKESVRARAGLKIDPDFDFKTHPKIDVLLIPGGVVTEELKDASVINWIATTSKETQLTASICTGAFLLAKVGLLEGKSATTHWEDINDLRVMFPKLEVKEQMRWVDEGAIVTSAGISAGIDMSLHLVERLVSRDLALNTARQMEFDWTENA
ncbi:DJ-1/PfpI family protein [Sulfurospirillum arsenophilum]|uniref:DJ-1/PfpI family protein n=1 Tax=Sulfurospirillum arsenophilum TaxID=56698 RepID=UPI0005A767F0|nr:DJ-1/PfpI family protein [Sulfurospirillum arsenophilum]